MATFTPIARRMLCAAAVLVLVGSAQAFVPWTTPSGSADWFTWSDGGSDNGLFGDPTLVSGDTFVFTPNGFRAEATGGSQEIVADRLEVDLLADDGFQFTKIRVVELGDYAVSNPGATGEAVATANLFLSNNLQFDFRDNSDNVSFTSGNGNWQLEVEIDLSAGEPWTDLELVLNNNLIAVAGPDGATFIEKKLSGSVIVVEIIPEPATLSLLGLLLPLLRRR